MSWDLQVIHTKPTMYCHSGKEDLQRSCKPHEISWLVWSDTIFVIKYRTWLHKDACCWVWICNPSRSCWTTSEIINKTVDSATWHMTFSIFYRYIKTLCRFYALIFNGTESRKMVITGTLKVLNWNKIEYHTWWHRDQINIY